MFHCDRGLGGGCQQLDHDSSGTLAQRPNLQLEGHGLPEALAQLQHICEQLFPIATAQYFLGPAWCHCHMGEHLGHSSLPVTEPGTMKLPWETVAPSPTGLDRWPRAHRVASVARDGCRVVGSVMCKCRPQRPGRMASCCRQDLSIRAWPSGVWTMGMGSPAAGS